MLGPYEFECNYSVVDKEFLNSIGFLLGPTLLPGNSIQVIHNEQDKSVFNSISTAKRSICVQTSRPWSSTQANEIAELLAEKSESGVPVHIVLPSVAARHSFSSSQLVRFNATDAEVFTLKRWFKLTRPNSDFTLITVDGMNSAIISPDWQLGFALSGPVVGQLQAAFNETWMQAQEQVAHGEFYFAESLSDPKNSIYGSTLLAQYFDGSNIKTPHRLYLSALYSIGVAKESLKISSAISDWLPHINRELKKAAQRGVNIEVINSPYRAVVVDSVWSSLGIRSEAVLNVHSDTFARDLLRLI